MVSPKPINPVGECFDSVAFQVMSGRTKITKICHGIGIATAPGQEGQTMKHAWLEDDTHAFDTTYGFKLRKDQYRKDLSISYCVEYTPPEFMALWMKHDYPGPWDQTIIERCPDRGK